MIAPRRHGPAAEHARAALLPEGEPGRPAHPVSWRSDSPHPARSPTVDEYAETLMAQRISMITGVAQVQVYGAQKYAVRVQLDPRALATRGIGIDEVTDAVEKANVNLPTGTLYGAAPGFRRAGQRPAHERRRLPPADRGLPQRRAGALRADRPGDRQRGERQGGDLVQRTRGPWCWPSSASPAPTPSRWWTTIKAPAADVSQADARSRCTWTSSTTAPISIRDSVDDVKFTLLLTVWPGGAGDLPVPAQRLGHHHSQPGAAHVDRGHVRGDVPAGLHASTTCR